MHISNAAAKLQNNFDICKKYCNFAAENQKNECYYG